MNTYPPMNTIVPRPKKPSMACMKSINKTSSTAWLSASPQAQEAADLQTTGCLPQTPIFARIGKQIAACAAWEHTDAVKDAGPLEAGQLDTAQLKTEPLPAQAQHITSTFTCRVLESGGWEIPKGSVVPAFTQVPPLSVIGADCVFGHHCTLLDHCTVGSDCVFGEACCFIGLPVFGDRCVFAGHCEFTAGAKFGHACVFGPVPLFNFDTEFGDYCSFPVGTDWSEFGLKVGADCVGAPVSSVEESKGVAHAH